MKDECKARTAIAREIAEILPLASPAHVVGHVETVEAVSGWLEFITRLNICQANDVVRLELITGLNACQSADVVSGDSTGGEKCCCDSEELHLEAGTTLNATNTSLGVEGIETTRIVDNRCLNGTQTSNESVVQAEERKGV